MSNRKETTKYLSELLEKYINPHNDTRIYYAKEVTFNYGMKDECRIDYMKFKPLKYLTRRLRILWMMYEKKSTKQ